MHKGRIIFATVVPLLCLAAPSIWLMASVPPLWRDADAYVQTVDPPGSSTILLNAPLYCAVARLPLWLGYLASNPGSSISFQDFVAHPVLTDAGLNALLWMQHAGFWLAALYLISAISASPFIRVLLAVFLASHPLFYSFAHCVGSETLSMIVVLLLVGNGLRIVLHYPRVKVRDWLILGAVLWACLLTRHINCVLAALLPVTIFALALSRWLAAVHQRRKGIFAPRFAAAEHARIWATSLAVVIMALAMATGSSYLLCRRAHIHWRRKFGNAFVWRLNFLQELPAPARDALLAKTAARTRLPETPRLFALAAAWFDERKSWDPPNFIKAARATIIPLGTKSQADQFDLLLDDMAEAFFFPPSAALVSAARNDFEKSTGLTEGQIARYLFLTTEYFFSHRDAMPQCAELNTFRQPAASLTKFQSWMYFRLWDPFSFRVWTVSWSILAGLAAILNRRAAAQRGGTILYAGLLALLGVSIMILNCFLTVLLPRYALPMMELLLASTVILLGLLLTQSISLFRAGNRP